MRTLPPLLNSNQRAIRAQEFFKEGSPPAFSLPLAQTRDYTSAEIVPTPPDVERGIVAFAKKAGICFGSIDFAVDMHGNWWFLEINERGQFLWLDQLNPKLKIQEKFCAFITAAEGSTQPLEEREGLFPSFAEYIKTYEEQQPKQEAPDIAAAAATSPYMSQEP